MRLAICPLWDGKIGFILISFTLLLLLSACDKEVVTLYPDGTDSTYIREVLETKERFNQRTKWWHDAKYGVFIHWNPSSVAGAEISWSRDGATRDGVKKGGDAWLPSVPAAEYDTLYRQFNPTAFDADAWVKTFIDLGFKYLMFITKHHDGFSMFDDPYNDYKICSDSSPVKYDITKRIVDACHKYGLRVGFYYTQMDWYHRDYFTANHGRFLEYMHNQVLYLLSNYGQIDVLWWDTGMNTETWDGHALYEKIVAAHPNIMFNDRMGGYKADFSTLEMGISSASIINNNSLWEYCHGVMDGWSWRANSIIYSTQHMFELMFGTWGLGGNFLAALGPRADGTLDPAQMKSVTDIGNWLKKYGECVYETFGGPYYNFDYGWATYKGNNIYLIVNNIKYKSNTLALPKLPAVVQDVSLITNGEVVFEETNDAYKFAINNIGSDNYTVIKITIEKAAINISPINGGN